MPEGPEVKRCSEVLRDVIEGKTITKIELVSGKLARQGIKNLDLINFPVKCERVSTKGKMITIELEGEHQVLSTLGMSGWWYPELESIDQSTMDQAYYAKVIDTITKAHKHTRLIIHTEDGRRAHYIDPRNFGNFYVLPEDEFCRKLDEIGIDLMGVQEAHRKAFWINEILAKAKKYHKKKISEVLLDQSLIAGLGNIYRAETLYLSKISPHRLVETLSEAQINMIVENAVKVLKIAYDGRGTMIYPVDMIINSIGSNFKVPEWIELDTVTHIRGHLAYGLHKDLFGNQVTGENIGGRTCWWVPAVQM